MPDILDSQTFVSASCVNLLLGEIVPTSIRVSQKLAELRQATAEAACEDVQSRIDVPLSSISGDLPGTIGILDSHTIRDDEVTVRIETYGYTLGLRLSEVLVFKGATSNSKIVDILDIMKFVCRDVWKSLYGKQMDNLRTNHRGTFVLVDNNYRLISRLNSAKGAADTLEKARAYLWFPCGVVRGILLSFGVEASVTAEVTQFPAVTFNIQTSINN